MGCTHSSPSTIYENSNKQSNEYSKHIVIIGAGFGGIGCLNGLAEGLSSKTFVTLLDARDALYIGATLQYIWTDRLDTVKMWSLKDLNVHENVNIQVGDEGAVLSLDLHGKTILLKDGNVLSYDVLVLSPGIVADPSMISGLKDAEVIDVCAVEQVYQMKDELRTLVESAKKSSKVVVCAITRLPYKCPPLPFEVVSLVDNMLREAGSDVRESVKVVLTCPVEFPFGGPSVQKKFLDILKQQNIEFWPFHELEFIEKIPSTSSDNFISKSTLQFRVGNQSEKKIVQADCVFVTMPQRAPNFVKEVGLCDGNGLIPVNIQNNRIEDFESVYAVGDVCHIEFLSTGKSHPKSGEFAYMMGLHVAKHILAELSSNEIPDPPSRRAKCVAECGVNGKGVILNPDFTSIIADPVGGKSSFSLDELEDAAQEKVKWINGYLEKFFGPGRFESFLVEV